MFPGSLPCRSPVELSQPVTAELRSAERCAPIDLNRTTNRPQLQLVADPNSTPFDQDLGQRDLELACHLRHTAIMALLKDAVKDEALIPDAGFGGSRRQRGAPRICASHCRAGGVYFAWAGCEVGGAGPPGFLGGSRASSVQPFERSERDEKSIASQKLIV